MEGLHGVVAPAVASGVRAAAALQLRWFQCSRGPTSSAGSMHSTPVALALHEGFPAQPWVPPPITS